MNHMMKNLIVLGALTLANVATALPITLSGRSSGKSVKHHQVTIDWYEVLGVDPKADHGEIVKAYYRKSVETHPEGHPEAERESHEEAFVKVHDALHVLGVKDRRERYDSSGHKQVTEEEWKKLLHTKPRKEAFEEADNYFKAFSKKYTDGTEVHMHEDGMLLVDFTQTSGNQDSSGAPREVKEDLKHVFVEPSAMPPLIDEETREQIAHEGIVVNVTNSFAMEVELRWHGKIGADAKHDRSRTLQPGESLSVGSGDGMWWSATALIEGVGPRQLRRWMVDARFGEEQSLTLKGNPKKDLILLGFVNKYDRPILLRQQGFLWGQVKPFDALKAWTVVGDEWELHDTQCTAPGTEACIIRSFVVPESMGPSLSIDVHPPEEDNMKDMDMPPEETEDGVRRVRVTVINHAQLPLVVHASRGLKAVLPASTSQATFLVRALDRVWVEEGKALPNKKLFTEQTIDGDTIGHDEWVASSSPTTFCEDTSDAKTPMQVAHMAKITGPRPGLSGCEARCEEMLFCSAIEYVNDTNSCSCLLADCRERHIAGGSHDALTYRFNGRRAEVAMNMPAKPGPGRVLKVFTTILAKGLNQWLHIKNPDPGCPVTFRNKMPFRVRLVTADALRWGTLAPGHEVNVWAHAEAQWHAQDDNHENGEVVEVYNLCPDEKPMTIDIERFLGPSQPKKNILRPTFDAARETLAIPMSEIRVMEDVTAMLQAHPQGKDL